MVLRRKSGYGGRDCQFALMGESPALCTCNTVGGFVGGGVDFVVPESNSRIVVHAMMICAGELITLI